MPKISLKEAKKYLSGPPITSNSYRFSDITGLKFNRITVIKPVLRKNDRIYWLGLCECGNYILISTYEIKGGSTKSCGCYSSELTIALNKLKRKPNNENSLAAKCPELIDWWDIEKNNGLTAFDVRYGCKDKYYFKCPKGHSFSISPMNAYRGCRCPICSGHQVLIGYNDLATTHPHIVQEWHIENTLKPTEVTYGSQKYVNWKCKRCGHVWLSLVKNRVCGKKCPKCCQSKPEKAVCKLLEKYDIKYEIQKRFEQNLRMPYDFYIGDWNLLIEYNGRLHYNKAAFDRIQAKAKKKIISFSHRIRTDKFKKQLAKQNNIRLLVIPYTYFYQLEEIIQKLVDNPSELPELVEPPIQYTQ